MAINPLDSKIYDFVIFGSYAFSDRALGEQLQKALGVGQVEVAATGEIESDITIRAGKNGK